MSEREQAAERPSPIEADAAVREPTVGPRGPAARDQRHRGALSSLDPIAAYERRTTRIREEIARNRRGEYTVPTWVLALALAAVIGLWILVLFVL
ncbi:XK-related protein [Glycomyces sp. TRM65418]|uniref:XK-related protein n=1 Tax=Glycomyces sp. TRM65418 TaxID=2867006 RepID=UPI001CE6AB9B|nr:XK-related protein [Glycomyces sp. TRM65418]MCC3763031.1 XK-related protein [Glycomyces sp. TRM65418]QZD57045.1 XK-related protein [Glycomyces sp. TRM65418]